jgi:hypothetical protein
MKINFLSLNTIGMLGLIVGVVLSGMGITVFSIQTIVVSLLFLAGKEFLIRNSNLLITTCISIFYIASIFVFVPNWPGSIYMFIVFILSLGAMIGYVIVTTNKNRDTLSSKHKETVASMLIVFVLEIVKFLDRFY